MFVNDDIETSKILPNDKYENLFCLYFYKTTVPLLILKYFNVFQERTNEKA